MNSKINKCVSVFLISISCHASAQTLIEFDNTAMIAIKDGDKIFGVFDARQPKEFKPNFSCSFFFKSIKKTNNEYQLLTFFTNSSFQDRDTDSDIKGVLIIKDSKWFLHTNEFHGGCASGIGENFIAKSTDPFPAQFSVKKRSKSVGIRLVSRKAYFFKRSQDGDFTSSSRYLVDGDSVAVLKEEEAYSFIQYSKPDTSKITKGWIMNSDLTDPFR